MKTQTVSEGLELILASGEPDRIETALRWLAVRQDFEIKKTELIVDEAGLREEGK